MRATPQTAKRVYEDFDPPTEWASEDSHDTLIIFLPGFRKEQLKIQVTSASILKVGGERPLGNEKWRRFRKELPIASNVDTNGITARFDGGVLYVKHPKVITQAEPRSKLKPWGKALPPQKPKSKPQAQKGNEDAVAPANANTGLQRKPEKEKDAKDASGKSDDAGKEYQKGKEPSDANQESTSPSADSVYQKTKEKPITGPPEITRTAAGGSEKRETPTTGNGDAGAKSEQEVYNQLVGSWAATLKKSKKVMNLIVAACLILVFVMYLKNAAKPTKHPTSEVP